MDDMNFMTTPKTICWDCAKYCGLCSWSKDAVPVEGWNAVPTVKKPYHGEPLESFLVLNCPEFQRDAWDGGLKRLVHCRDCVHYNMDDCLCKKQVFKCGPDYYCKDGIKDMSEK